MCSSEFGLQSYRSHRENCDPATDAGCEYMFPCGLISNSMFNDTFTLETQSDSSSCTCATDRSIPERFDCTECQTWPNPTCLFARTIFTGIPMMISLMRTWCSSVVFERAAREYHFHRPLTHNAHGFLCPTLSLTHGISV